jgi:hypothetical protein
MTMSKENQFAQECTEMLRCCYKPWMEIAELNTRMFNKFTDNTKLTKQLEGLSKAKSPEDMLGAQAELLTKAGSEASSMAMEYVQEVMEIFNESAEEMKQHFNELNEKYSLAASELMQTAEEAAHKFTPPQATKAKKHTGRSKKG